MGDAERVSENEFHFQLDEFDLNICKQCQNILTKSDETSLKIENSVYGVNYERNDIVTTGSNSKELESDSNSDDIKHTKSIKTKQNESIRIKGPMNSYITRVDMNDDHSKAPAYISSSNDESNDETGFCLMTTDVDGKSDSSDYSESGDIEGIEFEQLDLDHEANHQSTKPYQTDQPETTLKAIDHPSTVQHKSDQQSSLSNSNSDNDIFDMISFLQLILLGSKSK